MRPGTVLMMAYFLFVLGFLPWLTSFARDDSSVAGISGAVVAPPAISGPPVIATPWTWLRDGALRPADDLGVPYVRDSLELSSSHHCELAVQTSLTAGSYGRGPVGYFVRPGQPGGGLVATLRGQPVLGNRSLLASLTFLSTETGVAPGQCGSVELRLLVTDAVVNGQMLDSLRIRVENEQFYVLDLTGRVIAGSETVPAFHWAANTPYTLTVLLFQKGVWCRLSGAGLPGGPIEIGVPDGLRWIPNPPGFALTPNPDATGGELTVRDWRVTPIGPPAPVLGAIGDSITAGLVHTPEADSYVQQVTRGLGQGLTLNLGSGGATTRQDLERFSYEVAPFRPRVVWIEGGTNDLSAGLAADTILSNMQTEAALIHWAGVAVFSTVPPRNSLTAAQETQRQRLNAAIRACGRPVVDRDAVMRDSMRPDRLNPAFDAGDGTHLNAAGSRAVAQAALQVIQPLTR